MKKYLLLFILCISALVGCEQGGSPSSDLLKNTEGSEKETGQPQSQVESVSLPEYEYGGTYYKLETVPAAVDETAILQYLIPDFDESRVQRAVDVELGEKCSVEVDGVTHNWSSEENFYYYNDLIFEGELTEKEALAVSDDFVRKNGFDVADSPLIREEEDGSYTIEYALQYEGVLVDKEAVTLVKGDENSDVNGAHIQIGVNGNGITRVLLSHLFECVGTMEEYRGEEDFLGPDKLNALISTALKIRKEDFEIDDSVDYRFRVKEIQVLYVPFMEQGKHVFLPAFRVMVAEQMSGGEEQEWEMMLVDAVTGRIYRGGI